MGGGVHGLTIARWKGMVVPESTASACRVVVFGLGGTIAMTSSDAGGVVPALSDDQLVAAGPGLAETGIAVEMEDSRRLPGASLTFEDLAALAGAIGCRARGNEHPLVRLRPADRLSGLRRRRMVAHGAIEVDWDVSTDAQTGERVSVVVFYTDWFTCAVCGLELEGDEFELANLDQVRYLEDEDPWHYIPTDEDPAYNSWSDDRG